VGRSLRPDLAKFGRQKRKEQKMGLKGVSLAAAAIMIGSVFPAGTALAQHSSAPAVSAEGAPVGDLPLADYHAFDGFAVAHPEIVSDLSHNPKLVEDDGYLSKHPELRDFMTSHVELRSAFIEDPGDFLEPNSRRHAAQQ
jgi:hypothetical protein